MSSGGKRRSLLANAIESIGAAQPVLNDEAAASAAPDVVERPSEPVPAPSFLERRGAGLDELSKTVKKLTIRIKPSECTIWPGNARDYDQLSHERCASLIDSPLGFVCPVIMLLERLHCLSPAINVAKPGFSFCIETQFFE